MKRYVRAPYAVRATALVVFFLALSGLQPSAADGTGKASGNPWLSTAEGAAMARAGAHPAYAEGDIVFRLKDPDAAALTGITRRHALDHVTRVFAHHRRPGLDGIYKARIRPGSPQSAAEKLAADPAVEWAEPNYYRFTQATPNDPSFPSQKHLQMLNAVSAWDTTTGSANVVIAVIDTGVEWDHPDLADNIWVNTGEVPGDGIDNDGNGYIDDTRGWDFVSVDSSEVYAGEDSGPRDNDPMDFFGHGTHVAGIAGAVGNNRIGVCGVCWTVRLMPLRAGYKHRMGWGVLEVQDIADALVYAADNGADIVNMSYGSSELSHTEKAAIDYCVNAGVILIAAAGNDGSARPFYPAAYDGVVAVASVDASSRLSAYSNCGVWVDVAAPGEIILSTTLGGGYGNMSGTSMACPVISGVAGLIKSVQPSWTAEQVRLRLISTATSVNSQNPTCPNLLGGGLVAPTSALFNMSLTPTKAGVVGLWVEEGSGDFDGRFEPGETLLIRPSVRNFALLRTSVRTSLYVSDAYVSMLDTGSYIGDLPAERVSCNWDDTMSISILPTCPESRTVKFSVGLYDSNGYLGAASFTVCLNSSLSTPMTLAEHSGSTGYDTPKLAMNPQGGMTVVYQGMGYGTFTENQVYARSADAFGNWGSPVRLSDTPLVKYARSPAVAVGSDGRAHAAFIGVVASPRVELFYASQGPDGVWSTAVPLTNNRCLSSSGQETSVGLALDQDNHPHIVYADFASGSPELYYIYYDGTNWSTPVRIAALSFVPSSPKLLIDSQGTGYLIYGWAYTGDIYMAVLSNGVWSEPVLVVRTAYVASSEVLDAQDRLHMLYCSPTSSDVSYWRYDGSWSTPMTVATQTHASGIPLLAIGPDATLRMTKLCNPEYPSGYSQLYESTYDGVSWSPISPLTAYSYVCPIFTIGGTAIDSAGIQYVVAEVDGTPGDGNWEIMDVQLFTTLPDPSRVPSRPLVTDNGAWTSNPTSLHASWSCSHPSGIVRYEYAIGTLPGNADVRWWASTGTNIGVTADLTDTPLIEGQVYYVSVRALNALGCWSEIGTSDGIGFSLNPPPSTVLASKSAADDTYVDIRGAIVSASFYNTIYIEADDRSCGIRVGCYPNLQIPIGSRVSVRGAIHTTPDGERQIICSSPPVNGSGLVTPLGLRARDVGGGDFRYNPTTKAGQSGVIGGAGLNNIGLLVRVCGRVTQLSGGYLYIDDGSGLRDGTLTGTTPNIGIRVYCDPTGHTSGEYLQVTGISNCFQTPSGSARQIWARLEDGLAGN